VDRCLKEITKDAVNTHPRKTSCDDEIETNNFEIPANTKQIYDISNYNRKKNKQRKKHKDDTESPAKQDA